MPFGYCALRGLDTGYDALGRVGSIAYPAAGGSRLTVYNSYTAQGYLSEVKNAATGQSYWKANALDAAGRPTAELLGNGLSTVRTYNPASGLLEAINTGATIQNLSYAYDALGNLTRRSDAINNVTETFAYDSLNRLTQVTGPAPKTYAYDSLGNITSKSDVGAYVYGAKPHAVTRTTNAAGTVTAGYEYDANGNMISSGLGNNQRYLQYTSFNQVRQIQWGSSWTSFTFDPQRQRMAMYGAGGYTVYLNPRWDAGTHYEKSQNSQGVIEHTHHIYAGSTPVAIYTVKSTSPTPAVRYLHKDHLGSIDTITDESGNIVERLSYDAFGQRRQPNGQDGLPPVQTTHHGYTGHEHLDGHGLIHMNGRIYDPRLARFISADPIIQDPTDSQSLNRYAYVTNNPLKYTDPSGYKKFWKNITAKNVAKAAPTIIVGVVAAALVSPLVAQTIFSSVIAGTSTTALTTGTVQAAWAVSSALGGAAGGFVAGGLTGGNLKSAANGAISGGIFSGVNANFGNTWSATRVAANSVAGGVSSEVTGGRFVDGFKVSAVTSTASWGYQGMVGRDPSPLPGENKPGKITYPFDTNGRQLPDTWDMNVVGDNDLVSACRQGSTCSKLLNLIPGINATAALHDYWFNMPAAPSQTALINWGTMLPAAVITYPALVNGPVAMQLFVDKEK